MKFTLIATGINIVLFLAVTGVLAYIVFLLIKALRKYIKSEPIRK